MVRGVPLFQNGYAFVGDGLGLEVAEVQEDGQLNPLCSVKSGVASRLGGACTKIVGNTLYFVGGFGLAVFDISSPRHPKKLHSQYVGCATQGSGACVDTSATHLYVCGLLGLAVFQLHGERYPRRVNLFRSFYGSSLQVCDDKLFVASAARLSVYDISRPEKPTRICKLGFKKSFLVRSRLGAGPAYVKVLGKLAFVSAGEAFAIVDVADLNEPVCLSITDSRIGTPPGGSCVTVHGNYALVSGGRGVAVFDITNLKSPVFVTRVKSGVGRIAGGARITTSESLAYVAGPGGISVLSLRDPRKPELVKVISFSVMTNNYTGMNTGEVDIL